MNALTSECNENALLKWIFRPRYLAHGTATDYMFDVLHIPLPFTWEIYGDEKANNDDCFRMFNPVSRAVFEVSPCRKWDGRPF